MGSLQLATRMKSDRRRRLMTWRRYAAYLGVSEATIYNILAGRPVSDLTEARIQQALKAEAALPSRQERVS